MRSLPAVLAGLLALLLPVPAARAAAGYFVRSCDNGSISGWEAARFASVASDCRPGGGALSGWVAGAPGETAAWRFQAPLDTEIAWFEITRSYRLGPGVAFGSPVYQLQTFGSGARYSAFRPNLGPVELTRGPGVDAPAALSGQTSLEMSVGCGGGGTCIAPAASFRLHSARILLRDASAPRIEAVAGTLLDRGALSGVRTVRFAASDRGGGVRRAELLVDGVAVRARTVDANGGACTPGPGGEFATVVPCRLRVSDGFTLDTRALAEGPHTVVLRVLDATAANEAASSRAILVDNVPPPVNRERPAVSGEPREGRRLAASPGAWTGLGIRFAHRWQRDDGAGSWADVAGAAGAAYVPGREDVGRRLRVQVTATNDEGSTTAYSAPVGPVRPAVEPPAPGQPVTPPASSAAPSPPASAAPPAAGLHVRAWLVRDGRCTAAATVRYGSRVVVAGSVRDGAGRPVGGTLVSLLARVGDGRRRLADVARTGPDGRFTRVLGAGPSRRLVAAVGAARSAGLRLAVRAGVRLTALRRGRWVAVRGALRGGHVPAAGALVTVQGLRAHRWVALTTLRTGALGRFRGRVAASEAGSGRLRAAVPRQPGYPFARGLSPSTAPRTAARTSR